MNHPLKKLHNEAQHIRLSKAEKRVMYARIAEAMRGSGASRQVPGLYYFFAPQFAVPVAALLIVVLGGGTAYAAQSSLPGDALYTIKTQVNEPFKEALAFSVEDKIKFHAEAAQTRIEEAEVLASEDRLDETSSLAIEVNFEKHLAKREALAQKLEEEKPGKAEVVLAHINSSITAHSDVLQELGRESSNKSTKEYSGVIATKARSFARAGVYSGAQPTLALAKSAPVPAAEESDSIAMTMSVSVVEENASTTHDVEASSSVKQETRQESRWGKGWGGERTPTLPPEAKAAAALEARAEASLKDLQKKVAEAKLMVDASTYKRLEARLDIIEDTVEEGSEAFKEKEYTEASERFNEALDGSVTLSTFVAANKKFKKGILNNLMDTRGWNGDKGED